MLNTITPEREALRSTVVEALWNHGIRGRYRDEFRFGSNRITIEVCPADVERPAESLTPAEAETEALTLLVLTESRHPLIWKEILTAIRARGWCHSESLLRRTLGRLVRSEALINRRNRLGYALRTDTPRYVPASQT